MPLDTGAAPNSDSAIARDPTVDRLRPIQLSLASDGALGAALRRARETLGLDTSDIAQATRIRAPQIAALENGDFAALPAPAFLFGFVRAYAQALGVEPSTAVERLRAELPPHPADLRAPAGLRHEDSRKRGRWAVFGVGILVTAIAGWNFARHVAAAPARPSHVARLAAPLPPGPLGAARLGAPLPAPPEASAPPTYATPGVDPAPFGPPPATPDPLLAGASDQASQAGAAFQPAGVIYGNTVAASLLLQAIKPTSLVVRDARGAVVFARQLAAGEAWRAPPAGDLALEIGNPASVERFVDGRSRGPLAAARVSLASLRQP